MNDVLELPDTIDELKTLALTLYEKTIEKDNRCAELERAYLWEKEKRIALELKVFGSASEKMKSEDDAQRRLEFNEAEAHAEQALATSELEATIVKEHERKKPGRKTKPKDIETVEILHDLSEDEKACPCCGEQRPEIGEDRSEEYHLVPAKLQKHVHLMKKYGACTCADFKRAEAPAVVSAPAPAKIVPGSDFSNGTIAFFMTGKYQDAIPFYRMERILERYGLSVSRATLCNLAVGVGREIGPLIERMWRDARSSPVILMDETRVQVLKEPGKRPESQSFMWVTLGIGENRKILLYHYHPTRSGDVPRKALEDYEGYLQTDGYGGYNAIPGVKHVFCFAHIRRKFVEAEKIGSGGTLAKEGIAFCDKIFSLEATLRKRLKEGALTGCQFLEKRAAQAETVVTEFKIWLSMAALSVAAQTKLGHAVSYAGYHLDLAARFVDHAFLTPSTNDVENAIRPFVIGRKNWLFSDSPRGAHASAGIYSIIETAKANGLDATKYLARLFDGIPKARTEADWESLMPYGHSESNGEN